MSQPNREHACELCGVERATSFHHLIPRTLHSNKWFRKRYTKEEMRRGLELCKGCHKTLHGAMSEKEMGRQYSTREELLSHPRVARYVAWKQRRQPRSTTDAHGN